MAMWRKDVKNWLNTLDWNANIAIDEGGLALVVVGKETEEYLEIGGIPEE